MRGQNVYLANRQSQGSKTFVTGYVEHQAGPGSNHIASEHDKRFSEPLSRPGGQDRLSC
jgi:hypothetical protein